MKQSKKISKLKKLFRAFEEKKIIYVVLKNYEDFNEHNDVDLLIEKSDELDKVLKICGFEKVNKYPFFISIKEEFGCKNEETALHIKTGGITYGGVCLKDINSLLNRRIKYKYFYILGKEDALVHLILHALLNKGYFKESYIRKIEYLINKVDIKNVEEKLKKDFGNLGVELLNLIKEKKYEKAIKLRKKLLFKIFTIKGFLMYLLRGSLGNVFSIFSYKIQDKERS